MLLHVVNECVRVLMWQEVSCCWCWLHCRGISRHSPGTWIRCFSAH